MRASQGAASSAQATDRSLPGRPKAHSLRWALAPVAALRFLGRSGPPIAPLLFFRLALSATGGASPGNSPHRTRCAAVGGFAALRMRRAPCGYFAGLRRGGPNYRKAPANGAGGNARPVFALSVQPTAANSPRTGGAPGRAISESSFPPFLREEMGAPARQAPAGRPSLHRAGGYYPPLQGTAVATRRVGVFHGGAPSEWSEDGRARRVVAPHEVSGCGGKRADACRECSGVDR